MAFEAGFHGTQKAISAIHGEFRTISCVPREPSLVCYAVAIAVDLTNGVGFLCSAQQLNRLTGSFMSTRSARRFAFRAVWLIQIWLREMPTAESLTHLVSILASNLVIIRI
jgi:hypothetical protein